MASETRIITARRAYEFRPDQLRLSAISIPRIQNYIRQHFNFELAALGTPQQTFGEVPATMPPGVVFNFGTVPADNDDLGESVMIRFLHFEARRIVVDIAAPSAAIDIVFKQLMGLFAGARTPDGTPIIGEPDRIRDYSEITRHVPHSPEALISSDLRDIISSALPRGGDVGIRILVPSLRVAQVAPNQEYAGSGIMPPDPDAFVYELRGGTQPSEQVYFSAAPLATDAHLIYLDRLEATFAARVARPIEPKP